MMDHYEMAARVLARRDAWKAARRRTLRRVAAGAGCCCAAVMLCVGLLQGGDTSMPLRPERPRPGVENLQSSAEQKVPLSEVQTTDPVQAETEIPADGSGRYHEAVRGFAPAEIAAFFGGSYLDEAGRFTVVLTEDTPENRAAVCRVLETEEAETVFVVGRYTLDQLTGLQSRISNAMVRGQLPFVVSSGVYETENRIIVRVTDNDPALLQPLLALDHIGALRIEVSSAAGTEELIAVK